MLTSLNVKVVLTVLNTTRQGCWIVVRCEWSIKQQADLESGGESTK